MPGFNGRRQDGVRCGWAPQHRAQQRLPERDPIHPQDQPASMPGDDRDDADDPGPNGFGLPPPPSIPMVGGTAEQPGVDDEVMRQHHRDNPGLIHPGPVMRAFGYPQVFGVFNAVFAPTTATGDPVQALGLPGQIGHEQSHVTAIARDGRRHS